MIKTLKHSHVCGRSFDPLERAGEYAEEAEEAFLKRIRAKEIQSTSVPNTQLGQAFDAVFARTTTLALKGASSHASQVYHRCVTPSSMPAQVF